jgi:hypothetical protein
VNMGRSQLCVGRPDAMTARWQVYRCKRRAQKGQYACKIIDKRKLNIDLDNKVSVAIRPDTKPRLRRLLTT